MSLLCWVNWAKLECTAWSVLFSLGFPFCLSCLQQKHRVFMSHQRELKNTLLNIPVYQTVVGSTFHSLIVFTNAKAKGTDMMKPILFQIPLWIGFFLQNYWYKNLLHLCSTLKIAPFYCCMMTDFFMRWI